MTKLTPVIKTESLYINLNRGVATINLGKNYFNDLSSVLNSSDFLEIVKLYLQSRYASSDDKFDAADPYQFIRVIKDVLINEPANKYQGYTAGDILASIENLYSFYRSLLRVSVIQNDNNIISSEFRMIDSRFNELIRQGYRIIEEKLQGFPNKTYREINAASNAAILVKKINWKIPEQYRQLSQIDFINTVMLRPPMMMHTKSNKREGVFSKVNINPINNFTGQKGQWFCYPAKVGESLIFVYFNIDYLVNGIALSNLFELATEQEIYNHKPDAILLFGLENSTDNQCHYYHDTDNDLWIGEVPYTEKTTYFGYMKKMCLTLHNLHQIYSNRLPIHGSMVKIGFANGKVKNVVFFGDSGAGKSESLEALQEIADDKIVEMETIFDDMGSFSIDNDMVYAQGTETGAFVRLDDLSSAVAFNNMDRGVYLNPERKNARVIIPTDTYQNIIKHHQIDMWVYANNYSSKVGLHRFVNKDEAKETFISGKRKALGTTDEVGMSTTFFANPFGPVQEPDKTQPIIDKVFDLMYDKGVYVGEIYTHLGYDKSKESLQQSARELLDTLFND